jgi:hypothetical protein
MTIETELPAMKVSVTGKMITAAKAAYWHEVHNGGGYSDKCYEAAIRAALSSTEGKEGWIEQPVMFLFNRTDPITGETSEEISKVDRSGELNIANVIPLYAGRPLQGEIK